MIKALIGKKLGMTRIFNEEGKMEPVTVLEVGPCTIVQVKKLDREKYQAVQLGFNTEKAEKASTKPLKGHFQKHGVQPHRVLREVHVEGDMESLKSGVVVTLNDMPDSNIVAVTGISKGKGFQGVVRRHHFVGGRKTHGSNFHRAPGSIGASSWPSRVLPGKKLPGRMGGDTITTKGLKVIKRDAERNILAVRGAVPGRNGGYIIVRFS